jgi:MFS family permease
MINRLKHKDLKPSLVFALLGFIASAFVGWYQFLIFSEDMKHQIITQLGSMEALIGIAAIQGALLTFVAAFIGLKIARSVNLQLNFKWDRQALIIAIGIGFSVALLITGADRFIFAQYLPASITTYTFSPIYLISGLLYGGIVEEVLLRLLVMSLLVWILWKVFARSKDSKHIPASIYITAIILAAALFAAGHIPITLQTIGNTLPILIRCFVLNGVGGIGFGYLYWKKGLTYAMVAHAMTHVFMQIVLI